MRARRSMAAAVGLLALGWSAVVMGPTSSAAERPGVVSDSYEGETVECGYPIDISGEVTFSATSRTRSPKDPSAFFDHERVSFREVWTNPDTGAWFVMRGDWLWTDVTATRVDGNVYEYTSIRAGQPFVVEDSSGRVVDRDRGVLRVRLLLDTGGDDDPADEFVDVLGLDLSGPHPSLGRDTCRHAADLIGIGSTSSERYSLHPAGSTDSPLGYAAYAPSPDGQTSSPLLVFLHGAGESGDGSAEDLELLALQGIPRYLANDGWPDSRPFVVLAPQHRDTGQEGDYQACFDATFPGSCFMTTWHGLGHPSEAGCFTPTEVHRFIDYSVGAYDVDPSRVYLTGISCGAFGTWEYLETYGDAQVAAAVPIAGEGRPAWGAAGCGLASVPIWAFHGALDDIVDPDGSVVPITSLRTQCGVSEDEAGLTVYPDRDHDSWNVTYALGAPVDIYSWLLGHESP